jgi:hypothetical protein
MRSSWVVLLLRFRPLRRVIRGWLRCHWGQGGWYDPSHDNVSAIVRCWSVERAVYDMIGVWSNLCNRDQWELQRLCWFSSCYSNFQVLANDEIWQRMCRYFVVLSYPRLLAVKHHIRKNHLRWDIPIKDGDLQYLFNSCCVMVTSIVSSKMSVKRRSFRVHFKWRLCVFIMS